MPERTSRGGIATLVALVFAAIAVIAPFAIRGIACGHDLAFHMNGWMEVAQQWREGVLYPRWAANANYGGGEPRFLFYPPLSCWLGAALGNFIPWMFVPVAFDFCAVLLAGGTAFLMAREWFEQPDAALIAVAYALNPYMLLTIYTRSAFAEMLASCFFPLLVLWIVRDRPARSMLLPLALTIAGVWLANVPAAIIASYLAVSLLVVVTVTRRNSRVFLYGAAAIALGLALAGFYIVPVIYEKSWITVSQLLAEGVRPFENALFAKTGELEHDAFIRIVSWLALAQFGITAIAIAAAQRWRARAPRLWWSLVVSAALAFLLMLPVAGIAYRLMPDLQFLQFPWRWLLVVSLSYSVLVVTAIPPSRFKPVLYALAFVALIAACNRALQPQCDPEDTPFTIASLYRTGYGYMGTDEYTPAGADNYEIKPDFPDYRLLDEAGKPAAAARVAHSHISTYHKQFTVESAQPVELVLRLLNYPAWRVEVNGTQVTPQSDDPTGRIIIPLPTGRSEVDVCFIRTPDRRLGDGISVATLFLLIALVTLNQTGKEKQNLQPKSS